MLVLLAGCAAAPAPSSATVEEPACLQPRAVVSRSYLTFFPPGDPRITQRGSQIAREFATAYGRFGGNFVVLDGHIDRQEEAAGDSDLGGRRAASVRAALVEMGVPAERIATRDEADRKPLVPTGPGVAEPQNRWVGFRMEGPIEDHARRNACLDWLQATYCPPAATDPRAALCRTAVQVAR